jgi:hypothetical protein
MYAKFDKLAAELSDDEAPPGRPVVTRLSAPSRVTIGPSGVGLEGSAPPRREPQAGPAAAAVRAAPRSCWGATRGVRGAPCRAHRKARPRSRPNPRDSAPPQALTTPSGTGGRASRGACAPPARARAAWRKAAVADISVRTPAPRSSDEEDAREYFEDEAAEAAELAARRAAPVAASAPPSAAAAPHPPSGRLGASRAAEFSRNGGAVGDRYLWSQTAEEVTISVLVPPGTRAKDVLVRLTPPPLGELGATHRLTVALAGAPPAVDAPLAFAVDAPQDAAAEAPDWELTDFDAAASEAKPRRAVRVTLRKSLPGAAMVHWWRAALAGDPGIDTASIGDRERTAQRTAAARAVWAEAEAEFKRRVQERERIEIDVDSEEEQLVAGAEA